MESLYLLKKQNLILKSNNSVYAITKHEAEMQVWRGTQEGLDAM